MGKRGISHADVNAVLFYTDFRRWSQHINQIVRR